MTKRKDHTQEVAAAKAGMSVRTARRVSKAAELPSQKPEREWRTRTNPFADVWDSEIVPLLRCSPKLKAITLLRKLQEDHADRFPDGMRRTLERYVSQWRALEGPSKEVFFPQTYQPGVRGLSDFTHMEKLGVTIAGVAFGHMLYHFVLAFSRWEYASVVDTGESFQALAAGLQNALWQAGGCPSEHRSDSLSAAFKNLQEKDDFTVRYAALLEHYGMEGTRNNRGLGHEYGVVKNMCCSITKEAKAASLWKSNSTYYSVTRCEGMSAGRADRAIAFVLRHCLPLRTSPAPAPLFPD